MSISKDQLEQSFKDKSKIELRDLVQLIEDNFGYIVTLKSVKVYQMNRRKK